MFKPTFGDIAKPVYPIVNTDTISNVYNNVTSIATHDNSSHTDTYLSASTLPIASDTVLGCVKIDGNGLSIDPMTAVLSASGGSVPAPHNLVDGTNHPVSGLTTGHFLKALGATSYGFAAHGLTASDVGAVSGTGANNRVAIYTGINTIEGDPLVTFDGTTLSITGNIIASGEISAFAGSAPTNWWDSMPAATASTLGGIKVGSGLSIASGTLSVTAGGGMVYPGAGIPLSTGSAWGTSITNNSANWNTAYGWGNWASYFGTAAGYICQGNDSRLSDSRTPTSHSHGNITNAGAIGSTTNLPIITTTSGVLTTGSFGSGANTFCQGNDARLSDSRPASDVYAWAKASVKPSYTKSEVGLSNVDNTADASKSVSYAGTAGTATTATTAGYATSAGSVTGGITGTQSGSYTNYLTKYSGNATITWSQITDNGTTVAIGGQAIVVNNDSRLSDARAANGGTSSYAGQLNVYAGNESTISNGFAPGGSAAAIYINYRGSTGGGISTYYMYNGLTSGYAAVSASNFTATSDIRLKQDIESISSPIVNTEYKQFKFKSDTSRLRVGVIAQELQKTHPEFVYEDDKGLLAVSYQDLHSKEIHDLKVRIKELELIVYGLTK